MPTKSQLESALRNADAAGDSGAAKQLANALKAGQYSADGQQAQQQVGPTAAPSVGAQEAQAKAEPTESLGGKIAQGVGDMVAGGVRGAGSIGATILAPIDMAVDAIDGKGLSLESNRKRRADMTGALGELGANTDSIPFQGGKIASEVAGTAAVGGILAAGAKLAKAPAAIVSSLSSGGMKLGTPAATTAFGKSMEWLARITGGAATGGAQAGLVDPEQAKAGAVIGGALPGAAKVAGAAGDYLKRGSGWAITHSIGSLTGTSPETVSAAFRAGKKGATDFLDNMRGKADFGDVVDAAKRGLSNMREARAQAYRSGMVDIKADQSVLDFTGVDKALGNVVSTGSFKGVPVRQKAAETVGDLKGIVDQWRDLDPAQYHTPEGFDALKQAVGDIRDSTQFGTPARRAADQVYNSVKAEINKQAPEYAKVMKEYETASKSLKEIEKTLSLGEKTSKDTAIRKLQSLMRNNAQASYGNRLTLASELETKGGVALEPAIAGQAMNSWLPRGMTGALERAGAAGVGAASLAGYVSPAVLAGAPLTSPRLMGEVAYAAGRGVGGTEQLARLVSNPLLRMSPAKRERLNAMLRTAPVVTLAGQEIQR